MGLQPTRTARGAVLLSCLACLAACDIPTDTPIIETRWVVPIESTSIRVGELLPDGVTESGEAFLIRVDPFDFNQTLAGLCGACVALNGLTAPKPAFQTTFSESTSMPADVQSAELNAGTVRVRITNGISFDPIRPTAATNGSVTITLVDGAPGGRVLDQVVLDGASTALTPASTTTVTLNLTAGTVSSTITAQVTVDSPAGDAVLINTTDRLEIVVEPGVLSVASAIVDVANRDVSIDQVELDVEGMEDGLIDRIESGALALEIRNPFGVAISLVLEVGVPAAGSSIERTLEISDALDSMEI